MTAATSKLLIDEPPLQVLPGLAVALGLNEAIVLQQVHYLLRGREAREVDGRLWIAVTLSGWKEQLPWWSLPTIRRTLEHLGEQGVLQTARFDGFNRNTYYSINYDQIDQMHLLESANACDQFDHTGVINLITCKDIKNNEELPTVADHTESADGEKALLLNAQPVKPQTKYSPEDLRVAQAYIAEVDKLVAQGKSCTSQRNAAAVASAVAKFVGGHKQGGALHYELLTALAESAVIPYWAKRFLEMARFTTRQSWAELHNDWTARTRPLPAATPPPAAQASLVPVIRGNEDEEAI